VVGEGSAGSGPGGRASGTATELGGWETIGRLGSGRAGPPSLLRLSRGRAPQRPPVSASRPAPPASRSSSEPEPVGVAGWWRPLSPAWGTGDRGGQGAILWTAPLNALRSRPPAPLRPRAVRPPSPNRWASLGGGVPCPPRGGRGIEGVRGRSCGLRPSTPSGLGLPSRSPCEPFVLPHAEERAAGVRGGWLARSQLQASVSGPATRSAPGATCTSTPSPVTGVMGSPSP